MDEHREEIEAADLPPEALPRDFFFSSDVDSELARAMAEAGNPAARRVVAPLAPGNNEIQRARHEARAAAAQDGAQLAPLKIGVLISGSGTNLQALIDRIADGSLDATIELVVSSRPSAYGLKRAEAAGIQTLTLSKDVYADPEQADEIIAAELKRHGVEYVIMAGYMRKVHDPILASFPNRVVNLHPALLPSFPGAHAIQDAYDRGVKVTGVTVHFANADYDAGPIIAQRALPVEEGWSVDELEEHIHEIEHELYPEVVSLISAGRVHVRDNGTVAIDPE